MSHILPGQFPGMVAFSHTLFGLAHHTICTYYTMILVLAPYDFLLRARRKKRTPPPYLYAVSAPQKAPPQHSLYRVIGELLRPNSAEVLASEREIATIFCREYLTNFCLKSRSQQNK